MKTLNQRLSRAVYYQLGYEYRDESNPFILEGLEGGEVFPASNTGPALYKEADGNYVLGRFDEKTLLRSKYIIHLHLIDAMFHENFHKFNQLLDKVFDLNAVQEKGSPLELVTLLAAELIVKNPEFMEVLLKNGKAQLHPEALNVAHARATEARDFNGFNNLLKHCLGSNSLTYLNGEAPKLPVDRKYIERHLGRELTQMYLEDPSKRLHASIRVAGVIACGAICGALPLIASSALAVATATAYCLSNSTTQIKVEYTLKTDLKALFCGVKTTPMEHDSQIAHR